MAKVLTLISPWAPSLALTTIGQLEYRSTKCGLGSGSSLCICTEMGTPVGCWVWVVAAPVMGAIGSGGLNVVCDARPEN